MKPEPVAGSFRDPSGFLFRRDGVLYRQINERYRPNYELLASSGLLAELTGTGQLISHEEADPNLALTAEAWKVIRPRLLPFVSYSYEWCFSQLKDAALLTLSIQKRALAKGMSLKDASAYNVQMLDGRPVLIDTLSFEKYPEGRPWVAYRQFCQHFLAPLALMAKRDVRLGQLLRVHMDGVPLDLASPLLPLGTKLSLGLGLHIHAHARSIGKYSDPSFGARAAAGSMSRRSFDALIDSLESAVRGLSWKPAGTEWIDYYDSTHNYGEAGLQSKEKLVAELLEQVRPATVWDLGGNTGRFSRLAAARGAFTVCWDIDPACVEVNYRNVVKQGEKNLLPLLLDLSNPSGGIGWDNSERMSLAERGPVDAVLALGLIHHLAIANNVPLSRIAAFFQKLCRWLIVEFVPKDDPQTRKLLASREDVFPSYNQQGFKEAFQEAFKIERQVEIPGTGRTLYLLAGRTAG